MKCRNCGSQNPRGARFCGYCQHELKQENGFGFFWVCGILLVVILATAAFFGARNRTNKEPNSERISITSTQSPPSRTVETVHTHSWRPATCTTPQRCSTCGTESGTAEGHKWQPATYDRPQTCVNCGTTTGSPLNPLAQYEVGDILAFGSFEQDGSNGNGKEAIGWRVLAKTSDKMLVVSEHGLDSHRYHDWNESVDWEDCTVRTWLNGSFYDSAFNSREKSYILTTSNSDTSTRDKIFLLSIGEVERYFSGKSDRICYATRYALYQDAYANNKTGASWWLLRTEGKDSKHVMSVNSDGKIDYDGGKVASDRGVVRPAMWLDITD